MKQRTKKEKKGGKMKVRKSRIKMRGGGMGKSKAAYLAKKRLASKQLERLEAASIASVSFVPNNEEIEYLIVASNHAENNRKTGYEARTLKLSKFIDKPMLVPKTLDPNDTILAKLGRGEEGFGDGGTIEDKEILTVIPDGPMPLLEASNGPNGVLTDCQNKSNKYGENRINLFYNSKELTKKLLEDYLNLRNRNIRKIFHLHVTKMKRSVNELIANLPREVGGVPVMEQLDITEQQKDHYINVHLMMDNINNKLKSSENPKLLSDLGIGVVSYCQSWLRRGHPRNGDAHFSVMSPHFQTRFYIKDETLLRRALSGVANVNKLIESYRSIIERFTEIIQVGYGSPAFPVYKWAGFQWEGFQPDLLNNYQAFINLDGLATKLKLNIADEDALEFLTDDKVDFDTLEIAPVLNYPSPAVPPATDARPPSSRRPGFRDPDAEVR